MFRYFIAAIACGSFLLTGCYENETTVEKVAENELQAGAEVNEVAEVDSRLDQRTFTVDAAGWEFGDNVVVVSKQDLPAGVVDDARVRINGTVRKIAYIEIESEIDWDFDPQIEKELEEVESYIVADSVEVVKQEDE